MEGKCCGDVVCQDCSRCSGPQGACLAMDPTDGSVSCENNAVTHPDVEQSCTQNNLAAYFCPPSDVEDLTSPQTPAPSPQAGSPDVATQSTTTRERFVCVGCPTTS